MKYFLISRGVDKGGPWLVRASNSEEAFEKLREKLADTDWEVAQGSITRAWKQVNCPDDIFDISYLSGGNVWWD
jgi:hypothetical protein